MRRRDELTSLRCLYLMVTAYLLAGLPRLKWLHQPGPIAI